MKEFNKENVQIILAENELDYEQSAMILTVNDPWAKLGRTYEYSFAKVHEEDGELFVAKDEDRVVGCLLLEMHSTLKAFVRALCVSSEYRERGVGSDLLAFAEHRAFKETANVFLFVSSERAKNFYESNGYKEVGCLENLNVTGTHEWIMRKTIGPAEEVEYNKIEVVVLDGNGQTIEEVIRNAGDAMYKKGLVRDVYADKCIEREKVFSTGLPLETPVAIPHTDEKYVNRDCLCFQRLKHPVDVVEMGGIESLPCSLVINMGMTGSGTQVTMLSKMMEVLQDEDFINTCMTASKDDVKKVVFEKLGNL